VVRYKGGKISDAMCVRAENQVRKTKQQNKQQQYQSKQARNAQETQAQNYKLSLMRIKYNEKDRGLQKRDSTAG
jgi:hypothetical protein